jgi:hypothetical protein
VYLAPRAAAQGAQHPAHSLKHGQHPVLAIAASVITHSTPHKLQQLELLRVWVLQVLRWGLLLLLQVLEWGLLQLQVLGLGLLLWPVRLRLLLLESRQAGLCLHCLVMLQRNKPASSTNLLLLLVLSVAGCVKPISASVAPAPAAGAAAVAVGAMVWGRHRRLGRYRAGRDPATAATAATAERATASRFALSSSISC